MPITVVFTILLIGITAVSCSKDDEPTMSVNYDASCNESVNINISDIDVNFDLKYNVAGIALSNNRNDLENMENLGYVILKNYSKRDGAIDEVIGNVLVCWATRWNWYFDPEYYVDNAPYTHAEYNTNYYYYRAFSFGTGREGGELINLWLNYGDIEEFTTPQE